MGKQCLYISCQQECLCQTKENCSTIDGKSFVDRLHIRKAVQIGRQSGGNYPLTCCVLDDGINFRHRNLQKASERILCKKEKFGEFLQSEANSEASLAKKTRPICVSKIASDLLLRPELCFWLLFFRIRGAVFCWSVIFVVLTLDGMWCRHWTLLSCSYLV